MDEEPPRADTPLPLSPARHISSPSHEFVYAVVAHAANTAGIRCVFIKGPTLHHQGLREREHSGDVDVWVDPGRASDLFLLLSRAGWTVKAGHTFGHPMFDHSTTLVRGSWGCEIDVHHRFPDIAVAPDVAFEWVWAHSIPTRFAGMTARVPDRPLGAVIQALHENRASPGKSAAPLTDESLAVKSLRLGGVECLESMRHLGAIYALGECAALAYPGYVPDPTAEVPWDWHLRTSPSTAVSWLRAMRMVPSRERPRTIFRALWPSSAEIQISDQFATLRSGTPPSNSVLGARFKRYRRGISYIATAVRRK